MESSFSFVQFTHPGAEHSLSNRKIKSGQMLKDWNYSGHKRKFISFKGNYIDTDSKVKNGDLLFWGEWEPESKVTVITDRNDENGLPHFIHEPIIKVNEEGEILADPYKSNQKKRQNTDPCVFGDTFHYSCCKQSIGKKDSPLYGKQYPVANLSKGSLILFGSTINANTDDAKFVLDTVFVVGDSREYIYAISDLNGFVEDEYMEIMGYGLTTNEEKPRKFRCYKGVTTDNPLNGMYSFVPCKIDTEESRQGFKRVCLSSMDFEELGLKSDKLINHKLISDNLNTAPWIVGFPEIESVVKIWNKVRQIVKEQGFIEGVKFSFPPRIK